MCVTLPASVLAHYERYSRYNSPYPAHDRSRAIDLYPGGSNAVSPVAGTVLDVRTVRAPPRPYAADHDHLVLIDVATEPDDGTDELIARIMHVEPSVAPGDAVSVGDPLGTLVRAGFFAPWVDNHVHLEFRPSDRDPIRATGSVPIAVDVDVTPLRWDGVGRVRAVEETAVVLDSPRHPDPGEGFVGMGTDDGRAALDGGMPHYSWGGREPPKSGPVRLLGTRIGRAEGGTVRWDDVEVTANGVVVTGLSLFAARDGGFGAKLVCPGHDLEPGHTVTVGIRPSRGGSTG